MARLLDQAVDEIEYLLNFNIYNMTIKRMLMGAFCCLALQGVYAQCCSPAKQLMKRLSVLQEKGIMLGHQDDPVYGTTWKWDEGKSDVLLTVGDYPAIMGFDLGKLELDSKENLDGVPFDRMRQEIIAQHQRGGIVTLSWHPWNPVTGENAWDPKGDAVKAVLEGGAQQQKFESWLGKVGQFINSLKTADGKKVPVIFRPWHEMNGGWFWWGANSCTAYQYNMLYIKTYVTLMKAGCNNIVWAWSPNLSDKKQWKLSWSVIQEVTSLISSALTSMSLTMMTPTIRRTCRRPWMS